MIPVVPLALAFVAVKAWQKLRLTLDKKYVPLKSSVLLATYGSPYMAETQRGQLGGMYYSVVASMGDLKRPAVRPGGVMYRVDLPFATKVHLLGIPANDASAINPAGAYLEPVVLEGDFPHYFSLYAEKDMQTEARYVLDPAAMEFIVGFCAAHCWEIIGDQLIFLRSGMLAEDNIESVMAMVGGFIATIRPAIEQPISAAREQQRASYGQERRILRCPVCLSAMTSHEARYQVCPNGHGILAYGSAVAAIRGGTLRVELPMQQPQPHGLLTCPSCLGPMTKTRYGTTTVEIDTCNQCPYRWLDAGEIEAIRLPQNIAQLSIGTSPETVFVDIPGHSGSAMRRED